MALRGAGPEGGGRLVVESAAQAGGQPEFAGLGVELANVLIEPVHRIVEGDRIAEAGFVAEVVEHDGGGEGVGGHAAEGDAGPDADVFLQVGQIAEAGLDRFAAAAAAQEGAEAEGGEDRIAPAAIGILRGEEGDHERVIDRGTGLAELIKADHRHCGRWDGVSLAEQQGKQISIRPAGDEIAEQGLIPPGVPESLDLFHGLHSITFREDGLC